MRISIIEDDPGYDPKWHTRQLEIFCDGIKLLCCVTADTEKGYIRYWDERPSRGGQILEKHGKVEIFGDLT
jgi:hypothetical protein